MELAGYYLVVEVIVIFVVDWKLQIFRNYQRHEAGRLP